jgi:hypothetical protein
MAEVKHRGEYFFPFYVFYNMNLPVILGFIDKVKRHSHWKAEEKYIYRNNRVPDWYPKGDYVHSDILNRGILALCIYFVQDQTNWSFSSFSITTSTLFQDIYLSEVFKLQHQTKLCSKCNSTPVSSLNIGRICCWKHSSLFWMLLLPW